MDEFDPLADFDPLSAESHDLLIHGGNGTPPAFDLLQLLGDTGGGDGGDDGCGRDEGDDDDDGGPALLSPGRRGRGDDEHDRVSSPGGGGSADPVQSHSHSRGNSPLRVDQLGLRFRHLGGPRMVEDDFALASEYGPGGGGGFSAKLSPQSQSLMSFFSSPAARSERHEASSAAPGTATTAAQPVSALAGEDAEDEGGRTLMAAAGSSLGSLSQPASAQKPVAITQQHTRRRSTGGGGAPVSSVGSSRRRLFDEGEPDGELLLLATQPAAGGPPPPPLLQAELLDGGTASSEYRAPHWAPPLGEGMPVSSPRDPGVASRASDSETDSDGGGAEHDDHDLDHGDAGSLEGDPRTREFSRISGGHPPSSVGRAGRCRSRRGFGAGSRGQFSDDEDRMSHRTVAEAHHHRSVSRSTTPYSSVSLSRLEPTSDPYGSVSSIGSLLSTSMSTFSESLGTGGSSCESSVVGPSYHPHLHPHHHTHYHHNNHQSHHSHHSHPNHPHHHSGEGSAPAYAGGSGSAPAVSTPIMIRTSPPQPQLQPIQELPQTDPAGAGRSPPMSSIADAIAASGGGFSRAESAPAVVAVGPQAPAYSSGGGSSLPGRAGGRHHHPRQDDRRRHHPPTPARADIVLHAIQRFGMACSKGARSAQENHVVAYSHAHVRPFASHTRAYWQPEQPWPKAPGGHSERRTGSGTSGSADSSQELEPEVYRGVPGDGFGRNPAPPDDEDELPRIHDLEIVDAAAEEDFPVFRPPLSVLRDCYQPAAEDYANPFGTRPVTATAASSRVFKFDHEPVCETPSVAGAGRESAASPSQPCAPAGQAAAATAGGPSLGGFPHSPSSGDGEFAPLDLLALTKAASFPSLPLSSSLPSGLNLASLAAGLAQPAEPPAASSTRSAAARGPSPSPPPSSAAAAPAEPRLASRLPELLSEAVELEAQKELSRTPPDTLFRCCHPLLQLDSSSKGPSPPATAGPDQWTPQPPSVGMFGVFDGHGGEDCSRWMSQRLSEMLLSHPGLQRVLDSGWFSFSPADRDRSRRIQLGRVLRSAAAAAGLEGVSCGGPEDPRPLARMLAELGEDCSDHPSLGDISELLRNLELPGGAGASRHGPQPQPQQQQLTPEPPDLDQVSATLGRFHICRDGQQQACLADPPPPEPSQPATELLAELERRIERCLVREVGAAIRDSFQLAERLWLGIARERQLYSGSTAALALIVGRRLWVANVGDSEVVLSVGGKARVLSCVHTVERNASEAQRVLRSGGRLVQGRVAHPSVDSHFASLGVSRDLGNLGFKQGDASDRGRVSGVIADPHVCSLQLPRGAEFILLACDGLWDAVRPQKAASAVLSLVQKLRQKRSAPSLSPALLQQQETDPRAQLVHGCSQRELDTVVKHLVMYARRNGSRDNITAILVPLAIL